MIDLGMETRRGEVALLRRAACRALAQFPIAVADMRLARHSCNTTYRVTSGADAQFALHIVRFYGDGIDAVDRDRWIDSELWWLNQLRKMAAASMPVPFLTADGRAFASVDLVEHPSEPLRCILYSWVQGRFQSRALRGAHLHAIGNPTGELHRVSSELTIHHWIARADIGAVDKETEARLIRITSETCSTAAGNLLGSALRLVLQAQKNLDNGSDVLGLIHGDIHQSNYLFNGAVPTPIDFGDSGWGYYHYDLA